MNEFCVGFSLTPNKVAVSARPVRTRDSQAYACPHIPRASFLALICGNHSLDGRIVPFTRRAVPIPLCHSVHVFYVGVEGGGAVFIYV